MRVTGNGGRLDAAFLEAASVDGARAHAPTIVAAEAMMRTTLWSIRVVKGFLGPGKPCKESYRRTRRHLCQFCTKYFFC